MAIQASPKTGFEKWQGDVNKAVGKAKWNVWDCEIQSSVGVYNRYLSGTAGYRLLDWQFIKAIIWVETGANSPQWTSRPMQIGNPHDPGLGSLLSGKEGGDLILPPIWKGQLTVSSVRSSATYNIRAGIGYLLMKMANFSYRSVSGSDTKVYQVTVKQGDSFDKIAKAQGSTVEIMKKLNPGVKVLRPGQDLNYQKASVRRVITSWQNISTTLIAQYYNGSHDMLYAKKLDYALILIRKGAAALCAK